jgi:hypothetical protein
MENLLSLDTQIKELVRKKLSICDCKPCICTNQKKDEYFQELKAILARYNREIIKRYLYRDRL